MDDALVFIPIFILLVGFWGAIFGPSLVRWLKLPPLTKGDYLDKIVVNWLGHRYKVKAGIYSAVDDRIIGWRLVDDHGRRISAPADLSGYREAADDGA